MVIYAKNELMAKSRFWYFIRKFSKMKKTSGEIISCMEITEDEPIRAKNYGIWLRYNSQKGTHNMYKEYRDVTRAGAVSNCYTEMASRHRARFYSIQIIKVKEISNEEVKRQYVKQLLDPELKFPITHRVLHPIEVRDRETFTTEVPQKINV